MFYYIIKSNAGRVPVHKPPVFISTIQIYSVPGVGVETLNKIQDGCQWLILVKRRIRFSTARYFNVLVGTGCRTGEKKTVKLQAPILTGNGNLKINNNNKKNYYITRNTINSGVWWTGGGRHRGETRGGEKPGEYPLAGP